MILLTKNKSKKHGFSIVELLVAVTMISIVSIFVSFIFLFVAKETFTAKETLSAELNTNRLIDRTRTELLPASNIVITNSAVVAGAQDIVFRNPTRAENSSITTRIENNTQQVVFTEDVTDPSTEVIWAANTVANFNRDEDDAVTNYLAEQINTNQVQITFIQTKRNKDRRLEDIRHTEVITIRN